MRKLVLLLFVTFISVHAFSQKRSTQGAIANSDSVFFSKIRYRLVGPFRGGRSGAVGGDYKNKNTVYCGATGGGIWKTIDGGNNWKNSSDNYLRERVGAVGDAR